MNQSLRVDHSDNEGGHPQSSASNKNGNCGRTGSVIDSSSTRTLRKAKAIVFVVLLLVSSILGVTILHTLFLPFLLFAWHALYRHSVDHTVSYWMLGCAVSVPCLMHTLHFFEIFPSFMYIFCVTRPL